MIDLANCPQCASPQTQSFEMAYSMSTSSGLTAMAAYTFGVGPTIGGARSTQQSNLAAYVRPPIRVSDNSGWAIAIVSIFVAGICAVIASSVFKSIIAVEAAGGVGAVVFVIALVALLLLGMLYQSRRRAAHSESYARDYDEWRHWWICLRCGNRWRR